MRTFFILAISFVFLIETNNAQSFQIGFSVGSSVYLGDMDTPNLTDKTKDLNPALGFFFRQPINGHFAVKFNFIRGTLSAADSISSVDWQINRNLSFRTPYSELGVFLDYDIFDVTTSEAKFWWTPYFTAGVGYFHFNPTTTLNGDVLDLQPIGTEGQGLSGYPAKYQTNIMSFPIGGGFKARLTKAISIQAQLVNRIMFTDYIDDVSSRFFPEYEDLVQKGASPLQQLLYSRAWEVNGNIGPDVIGPEERKASPDVNDYVMSGTFSIFINIGDLNSDSGEGCFTAF